MDNEENEYLPISKLVKATNIAELLDDEELSEIGSKIVTDFEVDLLSRSEWEKRNEEAMKLALQVKEPKNFPWPDASNVKFPLITIAALQYHARAYPNLIGSDLPVTFKVFGQDPDGSATARATRIESHMSYQLLEEDEEWESESDKVLLTQPILGSAFKKSYFDPIKGHNVSEMVLAKDFVVNYWSKSIKDAPRITHVLYMSKNDVYERVASGIWCEMQEANPGEKVNSGLQNVKDKVQGLTNPPPNDSSNPYEILEHHFFYDFDGDGYDEPYIAFVRRDTKQVLRIVARFFPEGIKWVNGKKNGKILSIKAEQYFTKFPFIPSPDGGFYDLGFGVLLGPLNESINTAINQLIDAGTMATTAGGFLSRGIKMRGGTHSFSPLEWKQVETNGDDLRKGIMPLPVREPSRVLFELLNLLINYGERIGISVDILSGQNPGQNTPAETSRTMAEQGLKIFSGIFKRTFRAFRDEFRLLYRLNQLYLNYDTVFGDPNSNNGIVFAKDYSEDSKGVRPSADPHIISDSQRMMQAQAVKQAAMTTPGYDKYVAEKMYLKALKIHNIDQLYPDPKGPNAIPPMPNPKVQIEQMKQQGRMQETQIKIRMQVLQLQEEAMVNQAKIQNLQAQSVKLLAEAQGVETGHQIALLEAQIGAAKTQQDSILKQADLLMKLSETMNQPPPEQPNQQTPVQPKQEIGA